MHIASSASISEKHQDDLRNIFPNDTFSFFSSIDEVVQTGREVEILITYGEDITPEIIDQLPNLKWIQVISAGVEKMPLSYLKQKGILVTNARGIHGIQMAEYTLGLMLYHVRRFDTFFEQQRNLVWDRTPRLDELSGKTLGILGAGAIGQEIARKAKAFDMNVIGVNQTGTIKPYFDEMLPMKEMHSLIAQSDFIVLLFPLTDETRQIIREEHFRLMKRDAVFINIARGAVVDEDALIKALREEWIEAAYLDVFTEEPLPEDHPFWTLKNCWITPHVSGRTPHYMTRALEIFKTNFALYSQGKKEQMQNIIDVKKGY